MIDKVGAIIIRDKKILVARNKGKEWFFIPGGKRENDESDEECLCREIMEELGSKIKEMKFYRAFTTPASGKPGDVTVRAYFCEISGEPKPDNEIEELMWADSKSGQEKLGNILRAMIPKLKEDGFLT